MRGDTATLAIESRRNLANHILRGHTITPETPVTLAAAVSNKKSEMKPHGSRGPGVKLTLE